MDAFRRILVPVDFSAPSLGALDHAATMAKQFSARLTLLSVIEDPLILPYFPPVTPSPPEISDAEVEEKIRTLLPSEFCKTHDCRFMVEHGEPEDKILEAAVREESNLIVMGSHGRRRFRKWFIGPVTEHVLRRSSVPTLTVARPESETERWSIQNGNILYATDLSAGSERGLQLAHDLARAFGAGLTVLHVIDLVIVKYGSMYPSAVDHEELKREVATEFLDSLPPAIREDNRVRKEVVEGRADEAIVDVAERLHSDLIVVNRHSKNRIERALLGATADRVIRRSTRPVLSVPSPEL